MDIGPNRRLEAGVEMTDVDLTLEFGVLRSYLGPPDCTKIWRGRQCLYLWRKIDPYKPGYYVGIRYHPEFTKDPWTWRRFGGDSLRGTFEDLINDISSRDFQEQWARINGG